MSEITMPRLSDSMEEGTILTWLAGDGAEIEIGQELLEVETDKATLTVQSEVAGVLRILVPEGSTVAVGTIIAEAGAAEPATGEGATPGETTAGETTDNETTDGKVTREEATHGLTARDEASHAGNGSRASTRATPLARRAAREHGVRLEELSGSGPRGRITRDDVLAAAGVELASGPPGRAARLWTPAAGTQGSSMAPSPMPAAPGAPGETVSLTRIQQVIARRMSESRSAVPEFEVQTEVTMDEALGLRARLRELGGEGPVPSVNDLIVKAVGLALRGHPRLNATFVDGALRVHQAVHIGVAVATEDALIVPTVRDADRRSLQSLATETRRLAERVRSGQVSPEELSGAGFTVSNLGMFGMTAIRPIINAPQVAILGVGMAREVLARAGEEIVARELMTLTLSCDHRAVYGADAARFLSEVRELLQAPLRLLL
jgi:pyruvate dehydrogenase E2 component (dihydrolipoamide acetyltransferase)